MPNKPRSHKLTVRKLTANSPRTRSQLGSRRRNSGSAPHSTHSVKDLLARAVPILSKAADQSARQAFWRPWLETRLPPGLPGKITGITEQNANLVVFADSPAWSARLRYALQELTAEIRQAQPHIRDVTVRVMPRSTK